MLIIEKGQLVAGRYRLVESVGSGGMGIVWRARDERLERTVAIKQLLVRPELSEEQAEDARRRAMREARTAARLHHRNAIALFDVAEHDGDPWLVMEFLRSRSLSAVLADRGSLPLTEVAKIGAQVASALAAAHTAGIVHRDVKPANVLLDDSGLVKITDFGISRTLDDSTITQTGMLAGTPAYLAPEIARGNQPGRASDVFSLGATLYHAVEGAPPFGTESNPLALLHAVASGNVPPPRHAGMLTPVLMSMLDGDPNVRPTMEETAERLATLETMRFDELRTIPVRPPVEPPTRTMSRPDSPPPPTVVTPKPPQPPKPAARQPVAAGAGKGMPKRVVLIAALIGVFLVAGILTAILTNSSPGPTQQGLNPPEQTSQQQPPPSTPSQVSTPVVPVQSGPIDWRSAGELIIEYYGGLDDPAKRWGMLSENGRKEFGDQAAFDRYWGDFKRVSSRNAYGVTPNPDGSVNVPVDVTYTDAGGTERTEHKVLTVVSQDGKLMIDSAAK